MLATVYCVLPDMGFLFYEIRRFVSGLMRDDVARAARGLTLAVACIAAVFHHVVTRFLDSAYEIVAHHFLPFLILARIPS